MEIINCTILSGRVELKQSMLITKYKKDLSPSVLSERSMIKAILNQHGCLSKYIFHITAEVPDRVHTHLRTHHLVNEFYTCSTSRPDLTNNDGKNRLIDFYLPMKRLLEISQLRLCHKSWIETREFWQLVCYRCIELEPALKGLLFPRCVQFGYCPELNISCKYKKEYYVEARKQLLNTAMWLNAIES